MKTRRRARRITLEILYEADLANHDSAEVLARRLDEHPLETAGIDFVYKLVNGVIDHHVWDGYSNYTLRS